MSTLPSMGVVATAAPPALFDLGQRRAQKLGVLAVTALGAGAAAWLGWRRREGRLGAVLAVLGGLVAGPIAGAVAGLVIGVVVLDLRGALTWLNLLVALVGAVVGLVVGVGAVGVLARRPGRHRGLAAVGSWATLVASVGGYVALTWTSAW